TAAAARCGARARRARSSARRRPRRSSGGGGAPSRGSADRRRIIPSGYAFVPNMYWTVWPREGTLQAPRADPPGPAVPRPDPTSRSAAYGALVLTAALWGSSAVVARGLL